MIKDFMYVLSVFKDWAIFILPYVLISVYPAIVLTDRVFQSIANEDC